MKVVWLLAMFFAIVAYTPLLTWSGAGYVPGKKVAKRTWTNEL